jgi:hypothetical protein
VIFVGDRGLRRRRNAQVDAWLQRVDEAKWQDCPGGINARERKQPLPTRVQEVSTEDEQQRVFVIDSEERRQYEQGKRQQAMARTREGLEKVQQRVARGLLREPAAIGAAAERVLRAHHGSRYYTWELCNGSFSFREDPQRFPQEQRLEGRYVIATSEKDVSALDAVAWYKELIEVEHGFRNLKDVLALRPISRRAPRQGPHFRGVSSAAAATLAHQAAERGRSGPVGTACAASGGDDPASGVQSRQTETPGGE